MSKRGSHVEITRAATIPCQADRLFEYLREPNNDPEWCSTVRSSELVEGESGQAGAVYHQMHKPGPFPPSALEVTLLEIAPPGHIRLRSVDDVATFIVTYRIEDMGDGNTRVTQHDDIAFKGLGRIIAPFMAMAVRSGISRQFDELGDRAQAGALRSST